MLPLATLKTGKFIGITLTTFILSLPAHAYDREQCGAYGDSRSASGMGMGLGTGPGYYDRGYRPRYNYQRPPRPPVRPYGYQRPPREPMRPYGYQHPLREPVQPYGGYRDKPMTAPAAALVTSEQADAAAPGEITINIQGMAFQQNNITVKAGSTVNWVNEDSAPHTVTSMDGGPLASGTLNRADSYSVNLDQPGTYNYYCKFHPGMRATIVVE